MTRTRRKPLAEQASSAMGRAFLDALAQRAARNPSGHVALPSGATAPAEEVSRVLAALDRARLVFMAARASRPDRRRQDFHKTRDAKTGAPTEERI